MTTIINRHTEPLKLPVGGPKLMPNVPTDVPRWRIIKGHPTVEAWLAAKVLEEVAEGTPPELAALPPVEQALAMADGAAFMSFKAKAREVLGDDLPSTKADIIAALEAKRDADRV